jgi:UDP-N-acetylglucosamine 2-epimerase (non-hydrolysing)
MKKVLHIVGARPNFMKVAPIHRALVQAGKLSQVLVHTGQHYDVKMSDVFFTELGLPAPDVHLGIGSGSQTEQTAKVMLALEKVFLEHAPDLVSVVGDVTSTVAAALVAARLNIPLAHVEAGLRSHDRRMPEETNRIVTDRLADLLLTPSPDADENLLKEGVEPSKIVFVGNVMIDTLLSSLDKARALPTLKELQLTPGRYAVCTLHRPSNVDDPRKLVGMLDALGQVSREVPVVFPVHPRTRKMIADHGLSARLTEYPELRLAEPFGYLDFLALTSQAALVLTDSGGLQEESTAVGVPCLTLRENTERPVTVTIGTNQLVGTEPSAILHAALEILRGQTKKGRVPDLWDGRAAIRIADTYSRFLSE